MLVIDPFECTTSAKLLLTCGSLGKLQLFWGPSQRCEEIKASLCIVGMQSLAEMNRWREVLSWLLQYYKVPEKLPLKILEMCILLYSKLEEPHVILEVGGNWLRDEGNRSLTGYGTIVELYLLQVLLPLGQFAEAESLAKGCDVFSKEQQAIALRSVAERQQHWAEPRTPEKSEQVEKEQPITRKEWQTGHLPKKFVSILKLLQKVLKLVMNCLHSMPSRKILLVALIVYLIVLRLDPAASSSHPFIYTLGQLFWQMWATVFPARTTPPITS
uniref:Peroxisome assembly protein 26 isoform X2 n=1 Tax=Geotrypetes seraphini TaxID=260995 RepID=A0A6P8RR25_GEOSA|nr:peroxisome assembly protein 26 isoform X2 [Geotrypetes seraphini]